MRLWTRHGAAGLAATALVTLGTATSAAQTTSTPAPPTAMLPDTAPASTVPAPAPPPLVDPTQPLDLSEPQQPHAIEDPAETAKPPPKRRPARKPSARDAPADSEPADRTPAPPSAPAAANGALAAIGPIPPADVPSYFIDSFRIPVFLLPILQAAGTEYGVRWEILAAINEIETDYGRNLGVSSAGATGWMQFMPATWAAYGVDANRDGRADPDNPVDAIFAAARYLQAAGAQSDLAKAIFAYNHAGWYVASVLERAQRLAAIPTDLVDALTGLASGRSPVLGPARAVRSTTPRSRSLKLSVSDGARVVAVADARVVRLGRSARLGRFVRLRDALGNTYTYGRLARLAARYPVLKAAPKVSPPAAARSRAGSSPAGTPPRPGPSPAATPPRTGSSAAATPPRTGAAGAQAGVPRTADAARGQRDRSKTAAGAPTARVTARPRSSAAAPAGNFGPAAVAPRARNRPGAPSAAPAAAAIAPLAAARPAAHVATPGPAPPVTERTLDDRLAAQHRAFPASRIAGPLAALDWKALGRRYGIGPPASAPPRAQPAAPSRYDRRLLGDVAASRVTYRPLREGARVVAGTILGRAASTGARRATVRFEIRPAGRGAARIDPAPIVAGWRLLQRSAAGSPALGTRPRPSIGQVLLLGKRALQRLVLANPRITIYPCGRDDIAAGRIDRRVLATLQLLAMSGLGPTVSSLQCGHSRLTSSGNVSEHTSGNAVDIVAINGTPILGNQGAGSIADVTIRRLLTLQGAMQPHQIISLMTYPGAANTLALADHADHIHIGFSPLRAPGSPAARLFDGVLAPKAWERLIDRLTAIENPHVATVPSAASTLATPARP